MVKRRTQYTAIHSEQKDSDRPFIFATTKKQVFKKITAMPLNWHCHNCLRSTQLIKTNNSGDTDNLEISFIKRIEPLLKLRSIRKIWNSWQTMIRSIIPDGFRVLTNKYESIPTALSIRNAIKALIPTAYNCYLLDRDIRRYLGLELRHD